MSTRTEYKRIQQSKCNFCFNWFNCACTKKDCIHLCRPCLDKGQYTTCFKVHSPDSKEQYQLFLFKNNFVFKEYERVQKQGEEINIEKKTLIEDIDVYRNKQIKQLTQKWSDITDQIKKMTTFSGKELQQFTKLFDGLIKNYPTGKQVLSDERKINSEKQKNKKLSNEQVLKEVHKSVYNINKVAIPTIPMSFEEQKFYQTTKKLPLTEEEVEENVKNQKPLSFTKAFSTKVNLKNRNLSTKIKKNDVSTSSFHTEKQEKKTLSRNTSKQSLLEKKTKIDLEHVNKRLKDLELISKNELKAKIYNYLQTSSNVSPALFLPMTFQIYDAIKNTSCINKCIQLVSYNIQDIDIKCYMSMLQWDGIEILKLVKVGLTDHQFKQVIEIIKGKKLETLVATSNRLTETSIHHLKDISQNLPQIRYIYLGKNWIQKNKTKDEIKEMEKKLILYV